LCHVRRRDNLSSAIHMVVEALFWFHPVVWWIRVRLMEERERACDEEVLRIGGDPQDYAEGIVTVCKFYLRSPLVCVSGVTGSNLKRRVEAIMLNRAAESISLGQKLVLCAAGVLAVTLPLTIGVMSAPSVYAQEAAKPVPAVVATSALPEFEAASIKPSAPDSSLRVNFAAGGKLFITNATLRFLIKIAYDIGDDQLAGGPGWIGSKRFDLAATPEKSLGGDPKDMAPDQILIFHRPVRLRLQRLLADRFQLELRRESTEMPIFGLVVAKGGPKRLTATNSTSDPQLKFGNGVLSAVGVDMVTLAKFLSEGQTGRPVADLTGLKGKYDFHLEWAPDTIQNSQPADSATNQRVDAGGVSIFTALQQQLGLKLEARTDAADRLVVSRAALPSAN
jgi:bla regulator protein BlaR1